MVHSGGTSTMGHKLDLPYLKKYIDPSTGKPMLNNKKNMSLEIKLYIFNRPGVAGAVLQTAS